MVPRFRVHQNNKMMVSVAVSLGMSVRSFYRLNAFTVQHTDRLKMELHCCIVAFFSSQFLNASRDLAPPVDIDTK
jgi:hypothetical protein